jgi:hypothetical protein
MILINFFKIKFIPQNILPYFLEFFSNPNSLFSEIRKSNQDFSEIIIQICNYQQLDLINRFCFLRFLSIHSSTSLSSSFINFDIKSSLIENISKIIQLNFDNNKYFLKKSN